ncbi:chaperone protein HtpG-like [Labeo rohita]|uniref:chaperone protein HtpG-like n=1 Tax=Labeo rohita TaxID=84645 RepID=UPI0021E29BEF|nr:chaperone protein HtpG-like [Labeo rohita]
MSDSSFITPDLSDCGSPAVLVSVCLITATAHNRLRAQRRRRSTASSVTPKMFKVFIRELISNSSDALEKLLYKMITAGGDTAPMEIHLQTDAAKGTFTIQDTGVGMNREEPVGHYHSIWMVKGISGCSSESSGDQQLHHFTAPSWWLIKWTFILSQQNQALLDTSGP